MWRQGIPFYSLVRRHISQYLQTGSWIKDTERRAEAKQIAPMLDMLARELEHKKAAPEGG